MKITSFMESYSGYQGIYSNAVIDLYERKDNISVYYVDVNEGAVVLDGERFVVFDSCKSAVIGFE